MLCNQLSAVQLGNQTEAFTRLLQVNTCIISQRWVCYAVCATSEGFLVDELCICVCVPLTASISHEGLPSCTFVRVMLGSLNLPLRRAAVRVSKVVLIGLAHPFRAAE